MGREWEILALLDFFSVAFLVTLFASLLLGLVLGRVIRIAAKFGLIVAAVVFTSMFVVYCAPNQVFYGVAILLGTRGGLVLGLQELTGYVPYSGISFAIGLAVGIL